MDIMPTQQNDKKSQSINIAENCNFNFPMLFAGNNGIGNENSSFPAPASALMPTVTPINQLLQISQQLLNDGITKQKQIIQRNMNNNNNSNNNGSGKRSAKATVGPGEEDKAVRGLIIKQEISERKRVNPISSK